MGTGGVALLAAVLTAYLGFRSGGFFVLDSALGAAVLSFVLLLRVLTVGAPFTGLPRGMCVAAGALALLAAWTQLSALWSDSDARAAVEADRTLMYLCALLLAGSWPGTARRLRWTVRSMVAAWLVLCAVGLLSRVAPDVLVVSEPGARLGYPVTAPNTLGLIAALALTACFALSGDGREPPWVRVVAAAAMPLAGATLLLTYSRSALAVCVIGLVLVVVLGRSRLAICALAGGGPATAVAVAFAYRADLLVSADSTSAAAVAQGADLALVMVLCVGGAALMRTLLLPVDRGIVGWTFRRGDIAGPAALAVTAVAVLAVLVAQDRLSVAEPPADAVAAEQGQVRDRLTSVSSAIRLEYWEVALDAFAKQPVQGHGAGTYQLLWQSRRSTTEDARDAHSLGLETLAELGLVGVMLLAAALLAIVQALASNVRGPDRVLYGGVLAAAAMWLVHSSVEWDWEMPVATLWVFVVGGAALAAAPPAPSAPPASGGQAVRVLVVCAAAIGLAGSVRLAFAQTRLLQAQDAVARGDCAAASNAAESSLRLLERPEAYEMLGYCALRAGDARVAMRALERAVAVDPGSWIPRYAQAVVRASAGRDPRPSARAALQRNPRQRLAREAVTGLTGTDPDRWRRAAPRFILPLDRPRPLSDFLLLRGSAKHQAGTSLVKSRAVSIPPIRSSATDADGPEGRAEAVPP